MNGGPDDARKPEISGWYDLFSRGSRDWLRHNEKVRDAVKGSLPDILAGGSVVSGGARTVRVPVRMLEHFHFRLRDKDGREGVGQGPAEPGNVLGPPPGTGNTGTGGAGDGGGGVQFVLEFKVDDIVDWLWEELQLPNLRARVGRIEQSEYTREGWDRRGPQSRLDRRRSLREAIKRRGAQPDGAAFANDDLRFRQLARRQQPSLQAVVYFVLDVSGSMLEEDRKLAKSFFFWVVQGLRRQYHNLETVFVAHTDEAWQFTEEQFFQVSASGGTVASTAFNKVREIGAEHYPPDRWNVYVFYASDGDNVSSDRDASRAALEALSADASYVGYTEICRGGQRGSTEMTSLFEELKTTGLPVGHSVVGDQGDIWTAVRAFFTANSAPSEAASK
jgi:uncharacterized protein